MGKFLDNDGLAYFWDKIVAKIQSTPAVLPDKLVKYAVVQEITATALINASTLGGYSASHFAKASDLSNLSTSVSENTSYIYKIESDVSTLSGSVSGKLDKSGGTMTGVLVASPGTDTTVSQVRNIIISTEEPTSEDGSNGDIWIRYTE